MSNENEGASPCVEAQRTLMAQNNPEADTLFRSPCIQCKHRKQKCNRHWPCLHCEGQSVGKHCDFQTVLDVESPEERQALIEELVEHTAGACSFSHVINQELDDDSGGPDVNLEELGYSTVHVVSSSGINSRRRPRHTTQHCQIPSESPHLQKALQVLPSRACLDALVDNFLNDVNFHYYIVHPTSFRREYQRWCRYRDNDEPLGFQWTSLLLMVCACSAQYPSDALRRALEEDQGQSVDELTDKYHAAGRELEMTMPIASYHLYTVQQFLHSCLWFKTQARYFECWHALSAAIQVACELNIHCEEVAQPVSDYHLEMGRRAWAIMCTWDWQVGAITSHPRILQPDLYDTELPGFQLGGRLKEISPSPGLFMALQCELASSLLGKFGQPQPLPMQDIGKYRGIVDDWIARLPPHLALRHPDTSLDDHYPWLRLHRFNLSTMGLSSILSPLRPYLAMPLSAYSPAAELGFRKEGTSWSLRFLNRLFQFLRFTFPKDAKYHIVIVSILDVASLLCSAVTHDIDSSMPMRQQSLRAIEGSLGMLRTLKSHVQIAKQSYKILSCDYNEFLKQSKTNDTHSRKRQRTQLEQTDAPPSPMEESMDEIDDYWDGYDFSFTIPGMNDSPSSQASGVMTSAPTDNGAVVVGVSVSTSENAPSEISSNDMLADGPSTMPQHDDKNEAYTLSSSTGAPNLEDQSAAAAPSETPVHQIPESMPVPMENPDTIVSAKQSYRGLESEHVSNDGSLGVLHGIWSYNHLNLPSPEQ